MPPITQVWFEESKHRITGTFYSSSLSIFTVIVCITRSFWILVIAIRFAIARWKESKRTVPFWNSIKMYTLTIVRELVSSPYFVIWTQSLLERPVIFAKYVPRWKCSKGVLPNPIPLFFATWLQIITITTSTQLLKVVT